MLLGCSSKDETLPCSAAKPTWINDTFVGMSRITASGNKSEQKIIALQRAIAPLLMSKGVASGSAILSAKKALHVEHQDEILTKNFNEDIDMKVTFESLSYDIKVTDIYEDPCTKFLYIKIEEK